MIIRVYLTSGVGMPALRSVQFATWPQGRRGEVPRAGVWGGAGPAAARLEAADASAALVAFVALISIVPTVMRRPMMPWPAGRCEACPCMSMRAAG